MGFRPQETHYALKFEDPALNGLEVTVAEVTVGELGELVGLVGAVKSGDTLDKAAKVMRLFTMLGDALVEWNLEDRNGNPVPADEAGVKTQTLRLNLAIAEAWMAAMAAVDLPLPSGSSDGETSLEPSIPMELLSENPGS